MYLNVKDLGYRDDLEKLGYKLERRPDAKSIYIDGEDRLAIEWDMHIENAALSTASGVVRTAAAFGELSPVGALRCYLAGVEVQYKEGHIIGQDCFMWDVFSGDREYKIVKPAVKFGRITLDDQITEEPGEGDHVYVADWLAGKSTHAYNSFMRPAFEMGLLHRTAEGAEAHAAEIARLSSGGESC